MSVKFTHQLYLKSDRIRSGATLGELLHYFINSDNLDEDSEIKELLETKLWGCETLGDGVTCAIIASRRESFVDPLLDLIELIDVPATLVIMNDFNTWYRIYDCGLGLYESKEYYLEITRGKPYYSYADFLEDIEAVLRKILAVFPEAINLVSTKFSNLNETGEIVSFLCDALPDVPEVNCEFLHVTERDF